MVRASSLLTPVGRTLFLPIPSVHTVEPLIPTSMIIPAVAGNCCVKSVTTNALDVGPCILVMRMAFAKFKEFPGMALKFAADLKSIPNMLGKWQKQIELSQQLILSKQAS
jgi:hypothetical protein